MRLDKIYHRALAGETPGRDAVPRLVRAARDEPRRLLALAREVRDRHRGRRVSLCAIVNAKSGRCSEDCAFCAQSARHQTEAPVYPFIGADAVCEAAAKAKAAGVRRFGIVASGLGPTPREFAELVEAVTRVHDLGLDADVSVGLLEAEQLEALRRAGMRRLHHNLETSASFFPNICSSHAYEEDVALVRAALAQDMEVCCGGLFGLGESWEDRAEIGLLLASLGVRSVPVNFLTPIPGTRLAGRPTLPPLEASAIVALLRMILPRAVLRVCGGRETVFGQDLGAVLDAGADGLMVGNYLTTAGSPADGAVAALRSLGYEPV
ncbi:Biotin synthase [Desulfovibrio sp. X2]|uniref:biotin synthase BioB n=1 Tax=Desulfovibrio sp. X2 TaxID=941449 RepID=UPI00035899C8|nr:biotin synthase BioB [Desulfovibrio sp. X2]EPR37438.1 Biotin synthase [Desulfovibrio sp. X2]